MYIGNQHTNTSTATKIKDFTCSSCGHTAKAMVTGVGQGQGNSPYFMDEEGAKNRATKHANKNAIENVEETFKLATCPKCWNQDSANVRAFWVKHIGKIVAGMALFFGISLLVYAIVDEEFVFTIFGIISIPLVWFIYKIEVGWKWKTAAKRIQFLKEENL